MRHVSKMIPWIMTGLNPEVEKLIFLLLHAKMFDH